MRERIGAEGRAALEVWWASRVGMVVLAWIAAWLFSTGHEAPGRWLGRWDRWDAGIFVGIARDGYFGAGTDPTHVAFFPGFPWVLWVVHSVVRDWTAAGLVVSAVAGGVAAVVLGRLAAAEVGGAGRVGAAARAASGDQPAAVQGATRPADLPTDQTSAMRSDLPTDQAANAPADQPTDQAPAAARNATLFLALAPAAVFLAAGYSESLFAAFAFPAWHAARRDRWLTAVLLAAGASLVRVNGLFLAAAIALEFLLAGRARRSWRLLPLLAVPLTPVAGYVLYLHAETGDWLAWQHAQASGWLRTFGNPKTAWDQTWLAAFGGTQDGHTAWVFQLELVAVLVGLALTVYLLVRRRWPEAVYVGLSLLALSTTTWFMSVPRAMLLWWPLWTILGAWAVRRPFVKTLYICCVAPIMVGTAVLFLSGQWAG